MSLSSRLIKGTKPEPATLLELQTSMGLPPDRKIALQVFETTLDGKVVYCCLSGGAVVDGELALTLVGRAALESLLNLPLGSDHELIIQEVKVGSTPVGEKVQACIERAPAGAKVCFVGDMQGELDGVLLPALNFAGGMIDVGH